MEVDQAHRALVAERETRRGRDQRTRDDPRRQRQRRDGGELPELQFGDHRCRRGRHLIQAVDRRRRFQRSCDGAVLPAIRPFAGSTTRPSGSVDERAGDFHVDTVHPEESGVGRGAMKALCVGRHHEERVARGLVVGAEQRVRAAELDSVRAVVAGRRVRQSCTPFTKSASPRDEAQKPSRHERDRHDVGCPRLDSQIVGIQRADVWVSAEREASRQPERAERDTRHRVGA